MLVNQRPEAKTVKQYKQERNNAIQILSTQGNSSRVNATSRDSHRLLSRANVAILQRTLGNQSMGKLLQSLSVSTARHITDQHASVQNGNFIQRETHSFSQPSDGKAVSSKRRIIIDANVIDQINRGNQQAASTLLQLHTSSELYISRQAYNELTINGEIPRSKVANRLLLDELRIQIAPPGLQRERMEVYANNLSANKQGTTIVSDPDVVVAAQAHSNEAEIWSFDRAFRLNQEAVRQKLGVRVAPECTSIPKIDGRSDYRVGRQLLGLPPVEITIGGNIKPPNQASISTVPSNHTEADPASIWDDSQPTSSHSGGVSASGEASYSYSRGKQTTVGIDEETYFKDSSSTSAGVSFNPTNGQVGVNVGHKQTTEIGDKTTEREVSGSGYLDFNSRGELEGGGGSARYSSNGKSVSIGGGILVSAQPPQRDSDERYVVTWIREFSGSVGGGYQGSSGRGGSLSYEGRRSTTGVRTFATMAEAKTFYNSNTWVNLDPDNAGQLQAGDQISQLSSDQIGVGINGQVSGVNAGGSIKVGHSKSVEITSLGNRQISVKILDSEMLGGDLSLGAPGVSMSGGMQQSKSRGQIVTFDLSTSAGRSAFQQLRQMGKLPSDKRGYQLQAHIVGREQQDSSGFGLLGITGTNTNQTSETTTTYRDGRTAEERTGTDSTAINVPFVDPFFASDELAVTDDSSAEHRTYSVTSKVSSGSTQDVNKEIASSTGVGYNQVNKELDNQKSRRWKITSIFTHEQIKQLVREIRRGNWNYNALYSKAGDGEEFANDVRVAGNDWDRIDRALTKFAAEAGDKGLALIRDTLRINQQFSLSLEGDPYLTGESGHANLAGKIQRWSELLNARVTPRALGWQIAEELRKQRRRFAAVSDWDRYPDLPQDLRRREVKRAETEISMLEKLLKQASALAQQTEHTAAEPTKTDGSARTAKQNQAKESQTKEAQTNVQALTQVSKLESQVHAKRSASVEIGNEARRAHWIHHGAYAFSHIAYETWGKRHWLGDGEHAGEYESAKYCLNNADRQWREANTFWHEMKDRLSLSQSSQSAESIASVTAQLIEAFNKFSSAQSWYRQAYNKYEAIRKRHPEARNDHFRGYAEGYQLPDEDQLR